MATDRVTELEIEEQYDKIDADYQTISEIIEQLYKEGSTIDPETHAYLKRKKDPRFAPALQGMRKRTVPFNLDEFGDPIEGGKNFNSELDEYEELELSEGGRIGEIEQELMDLEYQQELEHFERVKDEPGLQEFSLAAPAAKVGILSQALKTGASKLLAPLQNLFSRINPTAAAAPISTGSETLAGLPSIMARGSGKGFERFGKRRGATTSRVNQNLDELISDFFAQSKGGTDLSNVSPYTLELIQANMPAIRAAAARQKQNPKAGLNRVIQLMEELE